jgi:Ca2+-binding EF-hand superfamily protein
MKGAGARQQKMVKRFIEKDTYRFDFSASELDRLVRLFRASSDDKKNETMRRETFMKIMNLSDNASKEKDHKEIALLHLLFDTFDVKGKGSITLQEFLIGISFWKAELSNADDKMIFFFNLFDKDQDGKLSQTEFSGMMHHIVSMEVYGKSQAQLPKIAHDVPIAPMEVSTPTGSRQGEIARKAVHIMFKDDIEAFTTGRLSQKGFKTWVLSNPGAVERLEATEGALLAAWALFSSTRGDKTTELMDRAQVVQIIQCTHIMEKALPHSIEILVEEYVERVFEVCELDVDGTVSLLTFRGWLVTNSHLGQQLVDMTRAERQGWGDGNQWESSGNLQKAVNDGSFKMGVLHVMTETERRATISNAINTASNSPGSATPRAMEKLSSMESFFKKKGPHTLSRGTLRGTAKQDSIRLKKGTLKRGTLKQARGAGEQLKKARDSVRSSISRASLRRKGSGPVKDTENPGANSAEAPGDFLRDSLSLDVVVI